MLPPYLDPTTPFLVPVEPELEANPMDVDDETIYRVEDETIDIEAGLIDNPEFDAQLVEDDPMPIPNDPVLEAKHEADLSDDVADVEQVGEDTEPKEEQPDDDGEP